MGSTVIDTHHDTALSHRNVLERLDAEGPTAPLILLGHTAQRTSKKIHPCEFSLSDIKVHNEIMLTQETKGCRS